MQKIWFLFLFVCLYNPVFSQDEENLIVQDSIQDSEIFYMAVKPSKAAFYSAILPGLGQAYNKDYWKIPVVYGALGTGIYFYDFNNDKYHKYRDLYKLQKLGIQSGYSDSSLESAQKYHKKYRDLSLLVTAGLYVLQIVEASVDAHMQYHNTDPELSFQPIIIQDQVKGNSMVGISFNYQF